MLLDAFPQPTPVRLGGRVVRVRQLRIEDLATLDGFVRDRMPLGLDAPAPGLDEWRTRRHWARQYLRAQDWPPSWGSEAASHLQETISARAFFLMLVGDGLDADAAVATAKDATDAEWAEARAVAHGKHPIDWLVHLIDPGRRVTDHGGQKLSMEEAVVHVAREWGLSFEAVGRFTLTQFRMALSGGKARHYTLMPRPGETVLEAAIERKRLFAGLDEPDPEEATADE